MSNVSIFPQRAGRIAAGLLVLFILIASVINVPWALTFMRSRTTINQVSLIDLEGAQMPHVWPAATPHDQPWPAPDNWSQGSVFGCTIFDVRTDRSQPDRNGFSMSLQQMGWPYPVIEQKQMWWDWDDPKLNAGGPGGAGGGPESDPALSLKWRGLLLNPLLLGGAAWMVLVLPWLGLIFVRRLARHNRRRCMTCGYPIGESSVCTECGNVLGTSGTL